MEQPLSKEEEQQIDYNYKHGFLMEDEATNLLLHPDEARNYLNSIPDAPKENE